MMLQYTIILSHHL